MSPSRGLESRWILGRCRARLRSAVAFSLAFKALNLIVLAPLAAALLRYSLSWWGRASVSNFELARFFFSPLGLVTILGVGAVLTASLYLELAGLLRLLARDNLHWWEAFKSSTRFFPRLVRLGLVQLAMYLVLAVPLLLGVGLAYWWFWSGKDPNSLIIVKPPEFWWGAGIAAVLLVLYAITAIWLLLRQLYAVPLIALESGTTVVAALQTSAERAHGASGRALKAIAIWFVVQSLLAAVLLGVLHWILLTLLHASRSSIAAAVLMTGGLLIAQSLAVNLLSVLANISFAAVLLSLYRQASPTEARLEEPPVELAAPTSSKGVTPPQRTTAGWKIAGGLGAGLLLTLGASWLVLHRLQVHENLEITAHRAGATNAAENTLGALEQAIADEADWVEIDVQFTADGELVVLHDIDLLRIGGGNRRVDQTTLAEIQALDLGAVFGPQFAGQRVPSFAEFLKAAGERVPLNIELKPHGAADAERLTRRVVEEIEKYNMTSRCRLCSQSYESLQLARRLAPKIELGFIVATTVGDPTQLEVNFLMVQSKLATRQFVERASQRGVAVHAWTVNDAELVAPLLDAGVANIITDDPATMRQKLNEIQALDVTQRLLLRTARALRD